MSDRHPYYERHYNLLSDALSTEEEEGLDSFKGVAHGEPVKTSAFERLSRTPKDEVMELLAPVESEKVAKIIFDRMLADKLKKVAHKKATIVDHFLKQAKS